MLRPKSVTVRISSLLTARNVLKFHIEQPFSAQCIVKLPSTVLNTKKRTAYKLWS
jgi:hypothetical protein